MAGRGDRRRPRPRPRHALILACALAGAACSSSSSDGDGGAAGPPATVDAPAPPAASLAALLCAASPPEPVGALAEPALVEPALVELSGLAASRSHPGVLWAHNDSGHGPRLFAIDRTGAPLAAVTLPGARAVDWEDVALHEGRLYVGDIGDNRRGRAEVVVYAVEEPDPFAMPAEAGATALTLRYPDGSRDAEALMVDPVSGRLVVVTKELTGDAGVYVTPWAVTGAGAPGERAATLELVATVVLGVGHMVTAGDIAPDGATIVLRTYSRVVVWDRRDGEPLAAALARPPCDAPAPEEPQGEAIALLPGGSGYVTVSEGRGAIVWEVSASAPAPTSTARTPGTSSGG